MKVTKEKSDNKGLKNINRILKRYHCAYDDKSSAEEKVKEIMIR